MYKNKTHGVFVMGFNLAKLKKLNPKNIYAFGA